MPRSQNGWSANNYNLVESHKVPGSQVKLTVRKGNAGDVLMYVVSQFDKRVEDIDNARGALDDWGYAERPIRGGTALSNHASGTAIDLNATKHPLSARGTFTQAQVIEIELILKEVDGVVRWGGHYSGRKDEMHFEINANPEQVKKVATKLRESTELEDDVFAVKYGASGGYVKRLQKIMNAALSPAGLELEALKPDGHYGSKTRDRVNAFAKKGGMPEEGEIGCHVLVVDYIRNWLR